MGEEMFLMQKIGQQKFAPNDNRDEVRAYNKVNVGFKTYVEWGIGGVKRKWRRLMKRFDST
jgi:hypothetical protein